MVESAVLHGAACPSLELPLGVLGRPALAEDGSTGWLPIATRITATDEVLEEVGSGLPAGAARAEALAARLARRGWRLSWGEPDVVASPRTLGLLARARGASAVELVRSDPSLLRDLQVGAWFDSPWLPRLVRRLPSAHRAVGLGHGYRLDKLFWEGVHSAATGFEWQRFTRSSYVVLLYHRMLQEAPPGEERLYVTPEAFDWQLRLLGALGFRPLPPDRLLAVHEQSSVLSRRRYVVTADDGFPDAVHAFRRHSDRRPQLFVPTELVEGGRLEWSIDQLASWSELRAAEDEGVAIGSHTRRHASMRGASEKRLRDELSGSLADLRERLREALPILAYPQGSNDVAACAAAAAAGYRAAYTTAPGRNSPGTDPYRLRRISVKAWDSRLSFLWKVLTGQPLPPWWERRRLRAHRRRAHSRGVDSSSS
jgi:peptidoglycan/xylan/chitin deacetylase (PgdA/CDA1 family)